MPPVLAGRDLLGQAATGTGKTAAFALPILQRFADSGVRGVPMALVLVPTRELAMQVSEAVHRYGRDLGARVLPVYGGQPIGRQLQVLKGGVDVVVATPGRAIDHIERGTLPLGAIKIVVLDEADEMLDMGFADDIESILGHVPKERQTVLFSATIPPKITAITRKYLTNPVEIKIANSTKKVGTTPKIRQVVYVVARAHKAAALGRVLDVEAPGAALVFCRTRTEVDQLTETMNGRGYRAEALHGGLNQEQRDRVMGRLRTGSAELLIATDVAARGLDIDQLTHVINYDVPSAAEAYVHRIGRVGRAGREGVAITLAEPREQRMLANIERLTKQKFTIANVPTVAELRNSRLEKTAGSIREALTEGGLDQYREVLESLSGEFDVEDLALAAVKLVHMAGGAATDDREIPDAKVRKEGSGGDMQGRGRGANQRGGERPGRDRGDSDRGGTGFKPRRGRAGAGPMAKLYVGAGKSAGVRPQDLVGAITGETQLSGKQIGAINIHDRFSLVEVPESDAENVIALMKRSTIKGKKANIRRDRTV